MVPVIINQCNGDSKAIIEQLRKIIKSCINANTILKESFNFELNVSRRSINDEEKVFKDQETQANYSDIHTHMKQGDLPKIETPDVWVLNFLKQQAIDIQSRMRPEKRSYYDFLWESFNLTQVLQIQLDGVYKDDDVGSITFKDYIIQVKEQIRKLVQMNQVVRIEKIFAKEWSVTGESPF